MKGGNLRLMVLAQGTSTLGDAAATVTLALRLHDATHSGWLVAGLLLAILGPSVVAAPAAGAVVSRLGPRTAFVLAACVQAAAVSALAVAGGTGPTLALAALTGAGFAVTQPAAMALLPSVVSGEAIAGANALLKTADWAGWTAGPLIGGGLVGLGAARLPLLLDGLSFLVAAGLTGAIRAGQVPAAVPPARAPARTRPGWLTGLRCAAADRPLAFLLLIAGVAGVAVAMGSIAEVFLARDVLRAGPLGYAALGAVFMAGTVAGGLLTPRLRRFPAGTTTGCLALAGAGVLGTGLAVATAQAMASYALAGVAIGVQMIACRSMVQRRVAGQVPADWQADVFAVFIAVTMGAQLAGFALGAAVIQAAGPRPAMCLAGGSAVLAGLLGYPRWRAWSRHAPTVPGARDGAFDHGGASRAAVRAAG